jgi:hypothetical protein
MAGLSRLWGKPRLTTRPAAYHLNELREWPEMARYAAGAPAEPFSLMEDCAARFLALHDGAIGRHAFLGYRADADPSFRREEWGRVQSGSSDSCPQGGG